MQPIHVFDGSGLTIAKIAELSRRHGRVDLSPAAWERLAASRAIVERHLVSGATIYGTNTGIGSQKGVAVADQQLAEFSNRMIVSEATDFPARSRRILRCGHASWCSSTTWRAGGPACGRSWSGVCCNCTQPHACRRYATIPPMAWPTSRRSRN